MKTKYTITMFRTGLQWVVVKGNTWKYFNTKSAAERYFGAL